MASALVSPFHGLNVSESLPGAADLTDLTQSSILQGRRRIRFQPQSGTTASPGSIIQFVLSDSTGLLDVNSMVLSCTIGVSGVPAAPNYINVMDEGASFCRRIQVLANGSLIEDIDNAHRASNMELLASAEADWYKHDGSFANMWKFNETLSVNAVTPQNNVQAHAEALTLDLSGNGYQAGWPLGLIAPSLRSTKYWPLRSMGELVLMITTANASEAIWCSEEATPTYTLSDIFLEVDIVVPHPAYASLMDRMTQLESEPGLSIPVTSRLVAQGQYIPATAVAGVSGSLTESSVITSRATTNLRKIMVGVQPTAAINAYDYPSVSCFPDAGFGSIQWRVGSLYFPSQPANSLARAFYATSAAFGEPADVATAAVFNRHNYDTTTVYSSGFVYANVPNALPQGGTQPSGQFGGVLTPAGAKRFPYSDFAVKAYCFDAYKNAGQPLNNDGISVLGQAGSQIVTQLRLANPENVTPTIVLDATKVIQLKDGGLRVFGS